MASRPNLGAVAASAAAAVAAENAAQSRLSSRARGSYRTGGWRIDRGFDRKFGVRIVMRREHGVTKDQVLTVPMRFQTPTLNQLQRSYQFNWETYSTIRAGQKSRPDGRQLLTLDIDTLLMNEDTADSSSRLQVWSWAPDPQMMIRELNWISGYDSASPGAHVFRLVLADPVNYGPVAIVNMLATIISVQATQNAEEPGAEYVTIGFQEFDDDTTITAKQRPVSHGSARVTLHAGDTLYEIAKNSHYHRASAWQTIAKANGITGVSPSSADDLAAWAKKNHRAQISIPAVGRQDPVA